MSGHNADSTKYRFLVAHYRECIFRWRIPRPSARKTRARCAASGAKEEGQVVLEVHEELPRGGVRVSPPRQRKGALAVREASLEREGTYVWSNSICLTIELPFGKLPGTRSRLYRSRFLQVNNKILVGKLLTRSIRFNQIYMMPSLCIF